MTFARPSLATIQARTATDIGDAAFLRRTVESRVARAVAGVSHALQGHLAWAARQAVPSDFADPESVTSWAATFGVNRKQPTKASGTVTFTGTNGTTVAAGTVIQTPSSVRYVTTAAGIVAGGSVDLDVEAEEYGADGNADAGIIFRLTAPIAGLNTASSALAADLTGGTDLEEIPSLLRRLIARLRGPSRGGSDQDYIAWAQATPGVDVGDVWVYPGYNGGGTVALSFGIGETNERPSIDEVSAVQSYVSALFPADGGGFEALRFTEEPVSYVIDYQASDPENPYPNAATEAAIEAALVALHLRDTVPGSTLLVSHIREAISGAAGELDHVLVTPGANVVPSSQLHRLTYSAPTFGPIS